MTSDVYQWKVIPVNWVAGQQDSRSALVEMVQPLHFLANVVRLALVVVEQGAFLASFSSVALVDLAILEGSFRWAAEAVVVEKEKLEGFLVDSPQMWKPTSQEMVRCSVCSDLKRSLSMQMGKPWLEQNDIQTLMEVNPGI